jgi:hypothetical protein
MNDEMKKKMDEMEQALLDSALRYQKEVAEPRGMLLQAKDRLDKFDWRAITEPPELKEALALVYSAASKF